MSSSLASRAQTTSAGASMQTDANSLIVRAVSQTQARAFPSVGF
jgi:hypothetical protein